MRMGISNLWQFSKTRDNLSYRSGFKKKAGRKFLPALVFILMRKNQMYPGMPL